MKTSDNLLHFKTNVLLKNIIGKDLINNDNIAVLELVKNSFDAGSESVKIIFENIMDSDDTVESKNSHKLSQLKIFDTGCGMNLDDIKDKWLNIAYSEKQILKNDKLRIFAGAKGVGRFSCDRLGEYLDLYTKKTDNKAYHLFIDWKLFEIENKIDFEIQNVDIKYKELNDTEWYNLVGNDTHQGTFLVIRKLRSKWTYKDKNKWNTDKLISLKRYLEKFINPNQPYSKSSIAITLSVPEFVAVDNNKESNESINGLIENKIFEKLDFTCTVIESRISDDGKFIFTKLTDKSKLILEIKEKNVDFPLLKNIKIVIFYLNPYAKAYFTKNTGIRSVDFGSIFLFINGFRVSVLGDNGNDWLRMEVRKGQGYARFLGTREVIGRIEIYDEIGDFQIVSSREGIVQNAHFNQLVDYNPGSYNGFFYKTLKRIEKYVVDGLDWDKTVENSNDIEEKVNNNNWSYDPIKEKYKESQNQKDGRFYDIIYPILKMDTNFNNIIDIFINNDIIKQLIDDKNEFKRKELQGVLQKYNIKLINEEQLSNLEKELEIRNIELLNKQNEVSKIKEEKLLVEKALNLEKEKTIKLSKNIELEKEKTDKLSKHIEIQKRQILFLNDVTGKDIKDVITLHHHIGIYSDAIKIWVSNIWKTLNKKKTVGINDLQDGLYQLNHLSLKISSITRFATRANFSIGEKMSINEDIIQFFDEYINNVLKNFLSQDLKIFVENPNNKVFLLSFDPTELSILIDNLISNSSRKEYGASELRFIFQIITNNSMQIFVLDNGKGLNKNILDPNDIFSLGFTTTSGTGLGLYHIREILKKINSTIEYNKTDEGFSLKIIIRK